MSAGTLSARRRVELMLPGQLLHRVVWTIVNDDVSRHRVAQAVDHVLAPVIAGFEASVREVVADLPNAPADKVARRVRAVQARLLAPHEDRPIATVYMAVVHLVQDLIDEGVLVAGDGPFRAAWDALATAIVADPACAETIDIVDRSAAKLGRRLLADLRREGYYPAPAGRVAA